MFTDFKTLACTMQSFRDPTCPGDQIDRRALSFDIWCARDIRSVSVGLWKGTVWKGAQSSIKK